jgi:hypothetical protein
MRERRRFERITLPPKASVYICDEQGNRIGPVKIIGRGGLLIETNRPYENAQPYIFYLCEDEEKIRRRVFAIMRNTDEVGVGFEFNGLDADAAVEIGVIIGKYYSARRKVAAAAKKS